MTIWFIIKIFQAVCGDVGQGKETDGLEERAKKAGASKLYIEDLRDEYVSDFIFPTLKAGAIYEGKYLLGTSHARPIIARRLVEIAKEAQIAAEEFLSQEGFPSANQRILSDWNEKSL